MDLQTQKRMIETKKEEINSLLQANHDKKYHDILKILYENNFLKIFLKDNQLASLHAMLRIWLAEKNYQFSTTILNSITNLQKAENLYTNLKFYCRRFEHAMPEEYYCEGISYICDNNITGIALYSIIQQETLKREQNILEIAKYIKKYNKLVSAILLLQLASKDYEENSEILLELADCWLEGNQFKQAYSTLIKIKTPSNEVQVIIDELKGIINNEKI